ncbi:trigger factor family protein [Kocuria rhizophila]|nr:trigger factor family protein [Kocuria rhizophila]
MKSAVEKLYPTEAKITIDIAYADLKPFVQRRLYKELANQIQIPGFRKGKTPSKLIDQRVGFDFVVENALNEGLNNFYQQALTENELTPLSQPAGLGALQPEENDREAHTKVEIPRPSAPRSTCPTTRASRWRWRLARPPPRTSRRPWTLRARLTLKSVAPPRGRGLPRYLYPQAGWTATRLTPPPTSPTRRAPAPCSRASTRP